jgi:hypothetical protein
MVDPPGSGHRLHLLSFGPLHFLSISLTYIPASDRATTQAQQQLGRRQAQARDKWLGTRVPQRTEAPGRLSPPPGHPLSAHQREVPGRSAYCSRLRRPNSEEAGTGRRGLAQG